MKKIISLMFTLVLFLTCVSSVFAQETETSMSVKVGDKIVQNLAISDLMPGDTEIMTFNLNVEHKENIEVNFYFVGENSSKVLAENLDIKIEFPHLNKTYYEGKFADFATNEELLKVLSNGTGGSEIEYLVTLYLPTTVGNECANQSLKGQFVWVSEDVDIQTEDQGETFPPQTGDTSNILPIILISVFAVVMIIVLLYIKSRRKNDE